MEKKKKVYVGGERYNNDRKNRREKRKGGTLPIRKSRLGATTTEQVKLTLPLDVMTTFQQLKIRRKFRCSCDPHLGLF